MGLFGDLDATEVADNPFYVAPDTYVCTLTEASVIAKKDGTGEGLALKWVITDDDSDFYNNSVQDWHNLYTDPDTEITPAVRRARSSLKARLLEMGLSNEEMNVLLDDDNLENLIGMEAYVTVVESTDKNDPDKKYSNVRKAVKITD